MILLCRRYLCNNNNINNNKLICYDLENNLINKYVKSFIKCIHPDKFNHSNNIKNINTNSLAKFHHIIDYAKSFSPLINNSNNSNNKVQHDTTKYILKFHMIHNEEKPITVRFFLPTPDKTGRNVQRYVYRRILYLLEKTAKLPEKEDISKKLKEYWINEEKDETNRIMNKKHITNNVDGNEEYKRRPRYGQDEEEFLASGRPYIFGAYPKKEEPLHDTLIDKMIENELIRFDPSLSYHQRLEAIWKLKGIIVRYFKEWKCHQWLKNKIKIAIGKKLIIQQKEFIVIPWNIQSKKLITILSQRFGISN